MTFSGALRSCPRTCGNDSLSGTPPASGGFDLDHDGPQEAHQLASDGDDGDLGRSFGCDSVEELEAAVLCLPRVRDDRGRLALLACLECEADRGTVAVAPGCLHEHVAAMAAAGLGDRALTAAIPLGILGGHQAEIGHERLRVLEPAPVSDLGGEHHGGVGIDAPEATQRRDHGLVGSGKNEHLDLAVELSPAVQLVLEEGEGDFYYPASGDFPHAPERVTAFQDAIARRLSH